jgi:hypothetical protein
MDLVGRRQCIVTDLSVLCVLWFVSVHILTSQANLLDPERPTDYNHPCHKGLTGVYMCVSFICATVATDSSQWPLVQTQTQGDAAWDGYGPDRLELNDVY